MDKLELHTGGHKRIVLDDLTFLQTAIRDGVKGLATQYGNCIISGVVLTNSVNPSWTAGWVILDGEIFEVDADSISGSAFSTPVLVPEESVASPSPVLYKSGILKNVHLVRKATIEEDASQPGKVDFDSINYVNLEVDLTADLGTDISINGSSIARARREGKRVKLSGVVEFSGGSASTTNPLICTLPETMRVTSARQVICCMQDPADSVEVRTVTIDPSGTVRMAGTLLEDGVMFLDPISFELD